MDRMKKLALMGILSVLAIGCGDDDGGRPGTDSGLMLMDSGMIVLPDTGMMPTTDAGTTPMGECAEPVPDLRDLAMDPMAPAGLLPRCTAETLSCINGASSAEAQATCRMGDTQAPLTVEGESLDCEWCWGFQTLSCVSDSCPSEYATYNCCAEAAGCTGDTCPACETQFNALRTCFQAQPMGTCNEFLLGCFPSM
jgi:hypothetical protein